MEYKRITPDEVAEWLVNDASDEEYAEALVLTYIRWKHGVPKTTSELTKEDMLAADTQAIADMVKEALDEILFSEDIDPCAWWKEESKL